MARYYETRLLEFVAPDSHAKLEELLRANPKFPWPHLDLAQFGAIPANAAVRI